MSAPRLTFNGFLKLLAKTPRNWRLIENDAIPGRLRNLLRSGDGCPLRAVFGSEPDTYYFLLALKDGLSLRTARRIVKAADSEGAPKTRLDLLKACGL